MGVNLTFDPNRKHVVSFDTAKSLTVDMLKRYLKPEKATLCLTLNSKPSQFILR